VQQQQQPPASSSQFGFIPSALNSFNPFAFFQSETETRPQQQPQQQQLPQQQQFGLAPSYPTKRPVVPQQQPKQQQQLQQVPLGTGNNQNIVNNINDYSAYLESLNAIQTIPAPDLTKIGPPVIELDTKDGEIVVGQPFGHQDRDHLAGFVSLDFDGFAAGGDLENNNNGGGDKSKGKRPVENNNNSKDKLSLIVGGSPSLFSNTDDFEADLVNLLNGKDDTDSPATFLLGAADKATPAGFAKLDLPFMDPTEHKGKLPKVFIAPLGKPIPKGYKGKPLPAEAGAPLQDIDISSSSSTSTTETVLAIDASATVEASNADGQSSGSSGSSAGQQQQKGVTAFRFKLQKERPSLSQFYLKNKKDKFEELKQQKKQLQPEKLEKFYPKNRAEDNVSKEQLPAVAEETAEPTAVEQLLQELSRPEADSEAVLPPLTVLSTGTTTQQQIPSTGQPEQQLNQLGETTTTVGAAASSVSEGATEYSSHEPIVQSTLEQQEQPIQEQQPLPEHSEQLQEEPELNQPTSSFFLPEPETSSSGDVQSTTQQEPTSTSTAAPVPVVVETTTARFAIVPETTNNIAYADETVAPTSSAVTTTTTTYAAPTTRRVAKTTQDPFVRLEALRKQKQEQLAAEVSTSQQPLASYPADLDTSEDEVASEDAAVAANSEATRPKTRLRLRKYGGGAEAVEGEDSSAAAPPKKFGKRIRTRKRPAFWPSRQAGNNDDGSIEPTLRPGGPLVLRQKQLIGVSEPTAATALEALKTEDYKKKFRPFFDQLYSQFNKGAEEELGVEAGVEAVGNEATTEGVAVPRRVGIPRKRSTTPQPPITVGKNSKKLMGFLTLHRKYVFPRLVIFCVTRGIMLVATM
jgi:hypothetical protein